ncbi:hypothetical protein B0I37DRAFT_417862 [Chaetomium sp. MPI-CAGE-AT-0009]|nr:hypothetical protein B0I37DRAFT_417862 [Chaetomium sp. MPI-CAGE-AT-0009]
MSIRYSVLGFKFKGRARGPSSHPLPPPLAAAPAHRPARRLTRHARVQPATVFHPQDPSLSPEAHFPLQTVSGPDRAPFPRFINRFDSREMLLVVDGSCVNNGRHANRLADPTGGWAFIFKGAGSTDTPVMPSSHHHHHHHQQTIPPNAATPSPSPPPPAGRVAFPLERHGPTGERAEHTSNRAKLRAVIGALQFRAWGGEGWRRVVVLTDLEYVVWGATLWLPRWVAQAGASCGGLGGLGPAGGGEISGPPRAKVRTPPDFSDSVRMSSGDIGEEKSDHSGGPDTIGMGGPRYAQQEAPVDQLR